MKKILAAIIVIAILLTGLYWFSQRQLVESQSTTSVSQDEERGSFLKTESRLRLLRDSLANLLFVLQQIQKQTPTMPNQLEETGSMSESSNPDWWLNSGGRIKLTGNSGETIQGNLGKNDRWYREYFLNNPTDTDDGAHPQNILRLVRRGSWDNLEQQVYFQINKFNLSSSPNRDSYNGLFLFNRYQSGDNLYYTGLRVDGAVVIKKKQNGIYYTMAYKKIVDSLPLNSWLGLRSEITNNPNGTVNIKVFTDIGRTGNWTLVLQAVDDGVNYGAAPITKPGFAGIRTDFMDVKFDNYSIREIKS